MSEPPIIPDEDPGPVILGWNDAPVSGDRVDVHQGPLIAGDPEGARVEVTGDGVHAYDATGTETATIQGEGGEFVGGSFRTSDQLPGQVTLADDAYVSSWDGIARPGIRVEPEDATGFLVLPGIGPEPVGMTIDGGRMETGEASYLTMFPTSALLRSHRADGTRGGVIQTSPTASFMRTHREGGAIGGELQTSPTASLMRTYRADGTEGGAIQTSPTDSRMQTYSGNSSESGWVQVRPRDAELAYVDTNNTYFSRIKADASEAFIYTRAGGTTRYLTVDASGVWVKTNESGSLKQYNLEETAQDSGWQSITPDAGYTGSASFAWRNKGGVIWYRGTVTATWTAGWNTIATLPAEVRPEYGYTVNEAGTSAGVLIRVQVDGRLELYAPAAGTSTHRFTSLSYPVG